MYSLASLGILHIQLSLSLSDIMYRKPVQSSEGWSREASMVKIQKCNSSLVLSHEDQHHQHVVWAQTIFECSFCKRQFRSAQALGGHMNVHRRERAKLASSFHHPKPKSLTPFSSPLHEEETKPEAKCACYHNVDGKGVTKMVLKSYIASPTEAHDGLELDLTMGLLRDHPKEDLDLELRLGFAN